MTDTKHTPTPGPWFVGCQNDALYVIDREPSPAPNDFINSGGSTGIVAELHGTYTQSDANARLIASAPDLLEALEAMCANLKTIADSGDAGIWAAVDVPEYLNGLAAIAKARGAS